MKVKDTSSEPRLDVLKRKCQMILYVSSLIAVFLISRPAGRFDAGLINPPDGGVEYFLTIIFGDRAKH